MYLAYMPWVNIFNSRMTKLKCNAYRTEEIRRYLNNEKCYMDQEDEYYIWYCSPDMVCPGWCINEHFSDEFLYQREIKCLGGGRYVLKDSKAIC